MCLLIGLSSVRTTLYFFLGNCREDAKALKFGGLGQLQRLYLLIQPQSSPRISTTYHPTCLTLSPLSSVDSTSFLTFPNTAKIMSSNHPPPASGRPGTHGVTAGRHLFLFLARLSMLSFLPLLHAAPQLRGPFHAFADDEEPPMSPNKPTLWIYLAVAVALVLLGGAFAGLTIALMGQVICNAIAG